MKKFALVAALAVSLIALGCGRKSTSPTAPTAPPDLGGHTWSFVTTGMPLGMAELLSTGNVLLAGMWTSNGRGLVYRTVDGGASWALASPSTGMPPVRCLAAFSGGTAVLAGTNSGIWRSNDGGATWSLWSSALSVVNRIAIEGTTAWAATSSGVFRSSDGGRTWSESGQPTIGGTMGIKDLVIQGSTMIASSTPMSRSIDGGASWVAVEPDNGCLYDVNLFKASSTQVLAGYSCGLQRSTDGGAHWTFADPMIDIDVETFAAKDSYLFAGGYDGVYYSRDNGAHWALLGNADWSGDGNGSVVSLAVHGNTLYASTYRKGVYSYPL